MGIYRYLSPMSVDYRYLPVITSLCSLRLASKCGVHGKQCTLPHQVGVVSHEPAVLHPTSQSEAQVHSDVVVQGAVVSGGIGTEQAVPVHHLPMYVPAFVDKGTALLNLFLGDGLTISYSPMFQSRPLSESRASIIWPLTLRRMKITYRHLIGQALAISCGIPIIPFSCRTLSPASIASGSLLALRSW